MAVNGLASLLRAMFFVMVLVAVAAAAFGLGLYVSSGSAWAEEQGSEEGQPAPDGRKKRVVYPKKTDLEFEGLAIEGELRNPGEFYFQHRKQEKFDSLVRPRANFHRELLRDSVMSR